MYFIWIKGKKYWHYDNFLNGKEAHIIAKKYKKKNGSRYFIKKRKGGLLSGGSFYALYMDKTIKLK